MWGIFREAATHGNVTDLQEYTESIICYINKCTYDVTVAKTIKTRANQKPWLTGEVCSQLRARNAAFKSGITVAYRLAKKNSVLGDQGGEEAVHTQTTQTLHK